MSDHSQVLGQYLLKGWCMLQETCPDNPSVPLMRSRAGVTICVACQNCAHYPRDDAQPQPQPAASTLAAPGRFTGTASAAARAVTPAEQKTSLVVSSTKTAATVMDAPDGWQFAADDAELLPMSAKSMKDSTDNDVDEDIKADDLDTPLHDHDYARFPRSSGIEKAAYTGYNSKSTTGNIDQNKNANKMNKIYSSTSSGISREQMKNWEMLAAKRKQLYRLLRDDVYYFDKMSHLLDVLAKMDTVLARYDAAMAEKEKAPAGATAST
eukprot:g14353.t1